MKQKILYKLLSKAEKSRPRPVLSIVRHPGLLRVIAMHMAAGAAIVFVVFISNPPVEPVEISVNADSAIIVDIGNGDVLFEKNADKRLQPASTVKVMTAVLALENKPGNAVIIPTDSVKKVEPTNIGLKPGIRYMLKDLISSILIKSANDSAVAIAEGVSGTEAGFVKLMNDKAQKIGMANTHFTSASGLPSNPRSEQYTTSRDLSRMMIYALRHGFILEEMSKKKSRITGGDNRDIVLKTHNKSLYSAGGAAWGKTGYTKVARRTFVGIDPSKRPKIAFALLRSNDLWDDISVLKNKGLELYENKHNSLFDRGIRWIVKGR